MFTRSKKGEFVLKGICYSVFREQPEKRRSGDDAGVVTPVPIPNTEVKHSRAKNSYACHSESRSLPGLLFFIFFPISMILPFILSPQNLQVFQEDWGEMEQGDRRDPFTLR